MIPATRGDSDNKLNQDIRVRGEWARRILPQRSRGTVFGQKLGLERTEDANVRQHRRQ